MPERPTQQARIRPLWRSVGRGIVGKCPHCGEGKLFSGYLEQVPNCSKCGEPLARYDAGLLVALLVGLIVIFVFAIAFLEIELAGGASPWSYLTILLPICIVVSLLVLRPCKGALVGLMWALRADDA